MRKRRQRLRLEKRYVSVDGRETSVALERYYWRLLECLGETYAEDWRSLARKLLTPHDPRIQSRTGFLRARILYLALKTHAPELYRRAFPLPQGARQSADGAAQPAQASRTAQPN